MIPSIIFFKDFRWKLIPRDYLKDAFQEDYDILFKYTYNVCTRAYSSKWLEYSIVANFIKRRAETWK